MNYYIDCDCYDLVVTFSVLNCLYFSYKVQYFIVKKAGDWEIFIHDGA